MEVSTKEEGELSDEEENGRSQPEFYRRNERNFHFSKFSRPRNDGSLMNLPQMRFKLPPVSDLKLRTQHTYHNPNVGFRPSSRTPPFERRNPIPQQHVHRRQAPASNSKPSRNSNMKHSTPISILFFKTSEQLKPRHKVCFKMFVCAVIVMTQSNCSRLLNLSSGL